jgi:hypothetical protein
MNRQEIIARLRENEAALRARGGSTPRGIAAAALCLMMLCNTSAARSEQEITAFDVAVASADPDWKPATQVCRDSGRACTLTIYRDEARNGLIDRIDVKVYINRDNASFIFQAGGKENTERTVGQPFDVPLDIQGRGTAVAPLVMTAIQNQGKSSGFLNPVSKFVTEDIAMTFLIAVSERR